MAGKKGCSGGARPGAGRKPRQPKHSKAVALQVSDPQAWLTALMVDESADMADRKDAAKALLTHQAKLAGDPGKKGRKAEAAKGVAGGKFAPAIPPRLVASGGKRI